MTPGNTHSAVIAPPAIGEVAPRRWWHFGEDHALALLLATMVVLPLAEIVLRKFSTGIPSAPDFLRHLTLLVGMVGGVVAARDGRLLALATAPALLRGRWKGLALVFNGTIYNYPELRAELLAKGHLFHSDGDTEVILRLYEREGIACLKRLNGMFAIAIDDAHEDALYLARDRIGEFLAAVA